MPSQAQAAVHNLNDTPSNDTPSKAVIPFNPSKPLVPFVGPGRLVNEFNLYVGGKIANVCSKVVVRLGHDPSGFADRIEKLFGSSLEERQSKLDRLYDGNIKTSDLEKYCLRLLNRAWPESSSETTQWAVFDFVIVLTTRYPGLRNLFCRHRNVPDPFDHVQNSKNWLREGHTSGPEFDFYREFASFCLHNSKVVELVESTKPSNLARIEWEKPPASADGDGPSCLNYVPIEELLLYCRDGPGFAFERLSAIRYLATILELPAFWAHDKNRLTGILSNICNTIYMLIEDTDTNEPSAEGKHVWIRLAWDSTDRAAHALLIGIRRLMPRLPTLSLLLSKLCRPDVITRFPFSSPIASEMKSCLQSGSAQSDDLVETPAFDQVSFMTQIDVTGTEGSIDQTMQSEHIDPYHAAPEPEQITDELPPGENGGQAADFRNSFLVKRRTEGGDGREYDVEAGLINGVSIGTEFFIQSKDYAGPVSSQYLGVLVAKTVYAQSSILIHRDTDLDFEVPLTGAQAIVSTWKNDASILKVFIHPDDRILGGFLEPSTEEETEEEKLRKKCYDKVPTREDADVVLRYDSVKAVLEIERKDEIVGGYANRVIEAKLPQYELTRLPFILDGIALFRYHLLRFAGDQQMQMHGDIGSSVITEGMENVDMRLYRLGLPSLGSRKPISETSLFKDNHAHLQSSEDARYGLKIENYTPNSFFPYLFYFDPSDYSIQQWFAPYSPKMNPPLHALQADQPGSVTVGYGAGGGDPIQFISGDDPQDTGFIKLFVSSDYVDMGHIAQISVIEAERKRAFKNTDDNKMWGASLAVVTVSQS